MSGVIPANDIDAEIDQAFSNVDLAVRTAGGKGWSQVFRINSYHLSLDDTAMKAMQRNMRKWLPDHQPIWTCIEVPRLGDPHMHVEIEVVAHDPEGAAKAAGVKRD
jgi:enamine deaminase RidA (YjgF/YER057c/UK114 family)